MPSPARQAASWSIAGAEAGHRLRRPERAPVRRDVGQPAAGEGQFLFCEVVRHGGGLPGRPGKIPAVHQELGDAQVKGDDARNRAEWDGDNPVEGTRLAESAEQFGGRVAIGVQQPGLRNDSALGSCRWLAAAEGAREQAVPGDDVGDEITDAPARAGVGPARCPSCTPAIS